MAKKLNYPPHVGVVIHYQHLFALKSKFTSEEEKQWILSLYI